jgi:hypothetical protein
MASETADPAIYVIATTPDGTARALQVARQRALTAERIALIVPAIVPDGRSTVDTAPLIREYGEIASRAGVRAPYVCVCRRPQDALAGFPTDDATVIIGGPTGGRSHPSPERDLAGLLVRNGRQVVFADLSSSEPIDDPS